MTAGWVLVLALIGGLPAQETEKDKKARAAKLLDTGNALFAKKKHKAALAKYEAAYAIYPSPKLYYSLGRAYDELGRNPEAATFYERFLLESGVEYRTALYERAHRRLRRVSKALGKLRLVTEVPGAKLFVDGVEKGVLPMLPLWLPSGRHSVRSEREGYTSFEGKAVIRAGRITTLLIDMPKVRVVQAPPPSPPPPPPEPELIELPPAPPPPEEPSLLGKWWFWSAVGAVVAAGVGTSVALAVTRDPGPPERELGETALGEWKRQ